ncbi:uncharacterized protein LOC143203533 [Rhynchophorus ferrugineus]|uniref:uncharacterized protein LOC143203533 n=1 Tax=Rhynchophorus ferrugineus TaxID=354439 RepID=UPI003FCDE50C
MFAIEIKCCSARSAKSACIEIKNPRNDWVELQAISGSKPVHKDPILCEKTEEVYVGLLNKCDGGPAIVTEIIEMDTLDQGKNIPNSSPSTCRKPSMTFHLAGKIKTLCKRNS